MTTEDARKLFVAGLPDAMTEEVLRQLFEATGARVVEASLPRDRATGRPRGFGFVTLETADQAATARSALDGSIQAGRSISVRPFQAGTPRREARAEPSVAASPAEDRTLYVGNLPYDVSQDELRDLLTRLSIEGVARIHLPLGPDGRPRGFGFVTLANVEAVGLAVDALRDVELRGRRVMAKVAHPRGAPPQGSSGFVGGRAPDIGRPMETPAVPRQHRSSEPPPEFEEDEEGAAAAERPSGKSKAASEKRGKVRGANTSRRRGERDGEDRRGRGGASAWQRWKEDWDED